MSIYKRKGQNEWSFDFKISGHRFSGTTGTSNKREAKKILEEQRTNAKALIAQAASWHGNAPITMQTAASRYWSEVGQHLVSSKDCYRALGWLVDQIGKQTYLQTITDSHVATMVAVRRQQGASNATVNRSVTEPLRAIAIRARDIWKVPAPDVLWKQHRLKEAQERIREASIEEERILLATIRPDYAPPLLFALQSGCRLSEIVDLQWQNVDFFNREFTVRGKGDKKRSIPMTRVMYELLSSLRGHHPAAVFTYVAKRTRGRATKGERYPITKSGLQTEWNRTKRRAGIHDYRFHDNRHTAATRLVRATGNLKMVQQLLGHTEIATTSRYAHVTKEDLRDGMEAADTRHLGEKSHTKSHIQ